MGTDIHLYMEYSQKNDKRSDKYWANFGGRFSMGRDYELFGIIAGLRTTEDTKHIPLRGVPENMGYETREDWWLYIVADDDESKESREARFSDAMRWAGIDDDKCKPGRSAIKVDDKGIPTYVQHPDWHSATWLTVEELEVYLWRKNELMDARYKAILAAANSFIASEYDVRFVLWFDN